MTEQQHPITPTPELVEQWIAEIWHEGTPVRVAASDLHIATQAYRAGADQELDACCEWLTTKAMTKPWETVPRPVLVTALVLELRAARRPRTLSLKEQALGLLNEGPVSDLLDHEVAVIRRALESLSD